MTASTETRHVVPESRSGSPAVAQRYEIAIGGAYNRIISCAVAEVTFQRWRERPDILLRGDLQTGFCWQWPDRRRTKVTVTPVVNETPLHDVAGSPRNSSAGLPVPGEPR